jgi:hypothetical protein
MKKSGIFILVLLILPLLSAVEVDVKSNFSQGETLIAKVSGNFLDPILEENIIFYRRHLSTSIIPHIKKIDNEYYLYASLDIGKIPDDYSFIIRDVRYMKGSQISDEEIIGNFSILDNIADFSIDKGFILTQNDFFITVQNLQDNKITIKSKLKNETIVEEEPEGFFDSLFGGDKEVTLQGDPTDLISGEIKEISFHAKDLEKNKIQFITIATENTEYEIPVYIESEEVSEEPRKRFSFDPAELNISIPTESPNKRIIYLTNTGKGIIENITLSITDSLLPYLNLSIYNIEELEKNETQKIEIDILSEEEINLEGGIKAKIEDGTLAYCDIYLNIIENFIPIDEPVITQTCSEINGTICDYNIEECNVETINTKDAVCCIGTCEEIQKSSTGLIIGWIIIIAILLFLTWFFLRKYRRAKRPLPSFFNPLKRKPFQRPVRIIRRPVTRIVEKPVIKIVEKPVIKEVIKVKKVFVERPKKHEPKYTGSLNTKKFHKSSCKFSKLIEDKYKVTKDDKEYFQKKGYKHCKVCLK